MNYAQLSPDSEILAAVGDSDQAYFYRRKLVTTKAPSQDHFPKYDWEVMATQELARGDRFGNDYSFSITFSPTGHLCAISAQGGMVSVLDMDAICKIADGHAKSYEIAMICSFKSSRPGICGCVRSMAFSPAPFDLLAWAEDHGRAGIADVRQEFCRRQIFNLDTHAPGLERIILEDMTDPYVKGLDVKSRLIHQYQEHSQPEHSTSNGEPLLGVPEDWSTRTTLQRQGLHRASLADLDAREQSILNTLEVTMEELDDAIANAQSRINVNYHASPHLRMTLESDERSASRAQLESLIDVFRERNLQRIRGLDRQHQPRRRNSVVLSQGVGPSTDVTSGLMPTSISRSRLTASPSRMGDADLDTNRSTPPPNMSTNELTPTSRESDTQPSPYTIPPSDPWHVIQLALESSTRTTSLPVATTARLTPPTSHHDDSDMADIDTSTDRPSESRTTERPSAQTSTLPTTLSATDSQAQARLHIRQYFSRRAVPLSELETERQIRRLTTGPGDSESRNGRPRPRSYADNEHHLRILEARMQTQQRLVTRDSEQPPPPPPIIPRTSSTRRSEFDGRATPTEGRLGRQRVMQSASNATDQNGNWVAGEALGRLFSRASVGIVVARGEGTVAREIGVGTAGVGWSVDGRQL
jgi:Uncharacterised protein domain (DUF2415)